LNLPLTILMDIYEQIAFELLELKEFATVSVLLKDTLEKNHLRLECS